MLFVHFSRRHNAVVRERFLLTFTARFEIADDSRVRIFKGFEFIFVVLRVDNGDGLVWDLKNGGGGQVGGLLRS